MKTKVKRSYRWPMIVVTLLATHVGMLMWAVVLFTRDPNSAAIPNYYEKAVRYDEIKAERARAMLEGARREQIP